jgi:hypothetical protein
MRFAIWSRVLLRRIPFSRSAKWSSVTSGCESRMVTSEWNAARRWEGGPSIYLHGIERNLQRHAATSPLKKGTIHGHFRNQKPRTLGTSLRT